jgi:hypothetical protein
MNSHWLISLHRRCKRRSLSLSGCSGCRKHKLWVAVGEWVLLLDEVSPSLARARLHRRCKRRSLSLSGCSGCRKNKHFIWVAVGEWVCEWVGVRMRPYTHNTHTHTHTHTFIRASLEREREREKERERKRERNTICRISNCLLKNRPGHYHNNHD